MYTYSVDFLFLVKPFDCILRWLFLVLLCRCMKKREIFVLGSKSDTYTLNLNPTQTPSSPCTAQCTLTAQQLIRHSSVSVRLYSFVHDH